MLNHEHNALVESIIPKLNPRMSRVIRALLRGTVTRKEADRIAGCANSPDLISDIRRLVGHDTVLCTMYREIDLDGKVTRAGRYSLTEQAKPIFAALLNFFAMVHADETTN
jgi:hypothetical protein